MKKTNSASRLIELLRKAQKHNETEKVFGVWADVFDIQETDQNRKNMEITRCLSLLHDEIDSVREDLNLEESDEFHCNVLLSSIFSILAVHLLMSEWKGLKPKLTRELFLCLGYCREVLPDEKEIINAEDIEELYDLTITLMTQLEDSTLPFHTKKLIKNHIDGIYKALHNYKIVGASSLQGAMNTILGEIIANEEVFKEAKGTQEISTLGKIMKKIYSATEKVYSATDGVVKTEKLLTAGSKIAKHGTKALEILDNLL